MTRTVRAIIDLTVIAILAVIMLVFMLRGGSFGAERRFSFEPVSKPLPAKATAVKEVICKPATKAAPMIDLKSSTALMTARAVSLSIYTAKNNCPPCKAFEKWRKENPNGIPCEVHVFEYESLQQVPAGISVPEFVAIDSAGEQHVRHGWGSVKKHDDASLCPKCIGPWIESLRALPAKAQALNYSAGLPAVDQLRKYATDSGRITFTPDQPVRAVMEDGSALSYTSIQGRYVLSPVPTITFENPLPKAEARKFGLRFGAVIQDAQQDSPTSFSLGTSRGRYRVSLEALP